MCACEETSRADRKTGLRSDSCSSAAARTAYRFLYVRIHSEEREQNPLAPAGVPATRTRSRPARCSWRIHTVKDRHNIRTHRCTESERSSRTMAVVRHRCAGIVQWAGSVCAVHLNHPSARIRSIRARAQCLCCPLPKFSPA